MDTAQETPLLDVVGINKFYGDFHAVKEVSFSLKAGEIGCLLGPSGCGKTTLLRTIAGFEDIASGSIAIAGQVVAGPAYVPPEKRGIGMVFQDYALFPHLTVTENVAFGLHGLSRTARLERVETLLTLVGLAGEGGKYPHELSGGQQQRVALARALAPEPALLLMDEPFSNLDVALRETLSAEIRDILKAANITALMVTHNQHEAFAMADKVGVVSCGQMQQWDSAYAVYHRPANTVVAGFVGEGALIEGVVERCCEGVAADNASEGCSGNACLVRCALGTLSGCLLAPCPVGSAVTLLIRPEDVVHDDDSPQTATIVSRTFRGPNILYSLQLDSGETVLSLVPSHHSHSIGQRIGIRPEVEEIVVFPSGSDFVAADACELPRE